MSQVHLAEPQKGFPHSGFRYSDQLPTKKPFCSSFVLANVRRSKDELTEFKRDVLEFLRQSLEDGFVTITRTRQSVEFPAQFTLVASTNPCPCGYYGDLVQDCNCYPRSREQYWTGHQSY